jgi:hypothetical protein
VRHFPAVVVSDSRIMPRISFCRDNLILDTFDRVHFRSSYPPLISGSHLAGHSPRASPASPSLMEVVGSVGPFEVSSLAGAEAQLIHLASR